MKYQNILSCICLAVAVMFLMSVSVHPAMAEEARNAELKGTAYDGTTDLTIPNDFGITIKKLPDSPASAANAGSTAAKNNPVVGAAITKLEAGGMEVIQAKAARYDLSIPDAALEQLKSETESLSPGTNPSFARDFEAGHQAELADFRKMQASMQQNARHENGYTISRIEMSAVTYTDKTTGESRNAVVIRGLDTAGNPTGATQILSDSGEHVASPAYMSAQSASQNEQQKLMKHYSKSCAGWTAGFWFLMAFILIATLAAIVVIIVLCWYMAPLIASATGFAAGYITFGVLMAAFWTKLVFLGATYLLVIPVISAAAIVGGTVGMPKMFFEMKEACTKNEEYGASTYSPDPAKKGALPISMRPDWNLLDNHRTTAWQQFGAQVTTFTGVQPLPAGGYVATGFSETKDGMNGVVTRFDPSGNPWQMAIGQDHITSINDVRVLPDGSMYLFGLTSSGTGPGIRERTGSDSDGLVIKLDPNGAIQWSRSVGGQTKDSYGFASGVVDTDGTIYAAGSQIISKETAAGFVAALNPDGTDHRVTAWENQSYHAFRSTGTSTLSKFARIQTTDDNGLILAGQTIPAGEKELKGWLLRLNPDKNQEWSVSGGSDNTAFNGVQETTRGDYVVSGYSQKDLYAGGLFTGDRQKLGSGGFVMTWSSSGQMTGNVDFANLMETSIADLQPSADGGYIVSGLGRINGGPIAGAHGGRDAWVAKLKPDLSIQWQKTLGGENDDAFVSAIEAANGDVVAVGYTKSNDYDLSGRGNKMDGKTAGWIVDLRYDPAKAPDTMDTWQP